MLSANWCPTKLDADEVVGVTDGVRRRIYSGGAADRSCYSRVWLGCQAQRTEQACQRVSEGWQECGMSFCQATQWPTQVATPFGQA